MAFIKRVSGTCTKEKMFDKMIEAIEEVYPNIASNPVQDYNISAGSDGFVCRITSKDGVSSGIVQIKLAASIGTGSTRITVNLAGDYTPGEPGQNGVFVNKQLVTTNPNFVYTLSYGTCPVEQLFNYDIVLYEDSFCVVCSSDGYTLPDDGGFEVGFPNPDEICIKDDATVPLYRGCYMANNSGSDYSGITMYKTGSVYNKLLGKGTNFTSTFNTNPQRDGSFLVFPNYICDNGYYIGESQCSFAIVNNKNIARGDIINIGNKAYKVFNSPSTYSMFTNSMYAVRVG